MLDINRQKELYVIESVKVGPNDIVLTPPTTASSFLLEGGESFDLPSAGANNTADAFSLSVIGNVGTTDKDKLIYNNEFSTVTIEDSGNIFDGTIGKQLGKFNIKYANNPTMKRYVETNWIVEGDANNSLVNLFSTTLATLGETLSGLERPPGQVLVDGKRGDAFIATIVGTTLETGVKDFRILVGRFRQADQNDFKITKYGYSKLLISELGIPLAYPQIAGCEYNGDIIFAISDFGDNINYVNGRVGSFSIFKMLQDTTFNITVPLLSDLFDVALMKSGIRTDLSNINYRIDNGITIEKFDNGLVVAVGISEVQGAGQTNARQKVNVISSTDLRNWTLDADNTSEFSSIDILHNISDEIVTCGHSTTNAKDNSTIFVFGTRSGKVLISTDSGQTFNLRDNFFTARNKMPIEAIHVMLGADGAYMIYISSIYSTIMRSKDSGQKWTFVAPPVDRTYEINYTEKTIKSAWNEKLLWSDFDILDIEQQKSENDKDNNNLFSYERHDSFKTTSSVVGFESQIIGQYTRLWIIQGNTVSMIDKANTNNVIRNIDVIPIFSPSAAESTTFNVNMPFKQNLGTIMGQYKTSLKTPGGTVIVGAKLVNTSTSNPELLLFGLFRITNDKYQKATRSDWVKEFAYTIRIKDAHQTSTNIVYGYAKVPENILELMIIDFELINYNFAYMITGFSRLLYWKPNQSISDVFITGSNDIPQEIDHIQALTDQRLFTNLSSLDAYASLQAIFDYSYDPTDATSVEKILFILSGGSIFKTYDQMATSTAHTLKSDTPYTIYPLGQTSLFVGQQSGFRTLVGGTRIWPCLSIFKNTLYLSVGNISDNAYEIWAANSGDHPEFNIIGTNIRLRMTTTASMQPDSRPYFKYDNYNRASLVNLYNDKALAMMTTDVSMVTYDMQTWYDGSKKDNPLPILPLTSTPLNNQLNTNFWGNNNATPYTWMPNLTYKSVTTFFSYGNGPIYGFIYNTSPNSQCWPVTTRKWVQFDNSETCVPCPMIKNFHLGAADASIFWFTTPYSGDTFSLKIRNEFPKSHIYIESPSIVWRTLNDNAVRSADSSNDAYRRTINLYWKRNHNTTNAILGAGTRWQVNFASLFNCNIPYAKWAISAPTYFDDIFPTNASQYTEFLMSSVVHEGILLNKNNVYGNILRDGTQTWTHNQFASGVRNWWIMIASNDQGLGAVNFKNIKIRKILNNGPEYLMYQGEDIQLIGNGPWNYMIFTDRMWNDGSYGTRINGYMFPEPGIANSEFEFGQWLRLTIPCMYPTSDDGFNFYTQIGKVVFGAQYPHEFYINGEKRTRHGINAGWRWNASTLSQDEIFPTGITITKPTSRTRQTFELPYSQIEQWEIEALFNMLTPNLKQAFCLIPDASNKQQIEYVRLKEGLNVGNSNGAYMDMSISLEEVI